MLYEHIDGARVLAPFSSEDEMLFRYRLEISFGDVLRTGKTACALMQNPSYDHR